MSHPHPHFIPLPASPPPQSWSFSWVTSGFQHLGVKSTLNIWGQWLTVSCGFIRTKHRLPIHDNSPEKEETNTWSHFKQNPVTFRAVHFDLSELDCWCDNPQWTFTRPEAVPGKSNVDQNCGWWVTSSVKYLLIHRRGCIQQKQV